MRGSPLREGETAQPVESHHQVLRRQDHAVRCGFGGHGNHAQVRVRLICVSRSRGRENLTLSIVEIIFKWQPIILKCSAILSMRNCR